MEDADVEHQVIRGKQLQPLDELRPDAEVGVGLVLDQPPDAAQNFVLPELVEFTFDGLAAFERQRGHHASEARVRFREAIDPFRLREVLRKIDIDLDEHEPVDLDRRRCSGEVLGQDLAVERRCVLCPGIAEPFRVGEMDVAVDDRVIGHRKSPSALALPSLPGMVLQTGPATPEQLHALAARSRGQEARRRWV